MHRQFPDLVTARLLNNYIEILIAVWALGSTDGPFYKNLHFFLISFIRFFVFLNHCYVARGRGPFPGLGRPREDFVYRAPIVLCKKSENFPVINSFIRFLSRFSRFPSRISSYSSDLHYPRFPPSL